MKVVIQKVANVETPTKAHDTDAGRPAWPAEVPSTQSTSASGWPSLTATTDS